VVQVEKVSGPAEGAGGAVGVQSVQIFWAAGRSGDRGHVGVLEAFIPLFPSADLTDPVTARKNLAELAASVPAPDTTAAKLLPRGRAVGIDLWRADQTGNSPDATRRNAEHEGVADRVELDTGDMRQLPFADNTFDLIISNLALHNIPSAAGRRAAIDEAVRVLRPGGRLAIADLWSTNRHRARLQELGLTDVRRRNLGWRMWWGGPWFPTRLVTATKNT
jgi:arsenite methyltransferase